MNMVRHDKVAQILMNALLILLTICCVAPFLLMVMASFTEEKTLIRNGYSFFPAKFSLETYRYLAKSISTIGRGYLMTVLVTVIVLQHCDHGSVRLSDFAEGSAVSAGNFLLPVFHDAL